jgi:23S rRNA (guanine745-N1)-methyltransferase
MHTEVVAHLRCPVCASGPGASPLHPVGTALRCPRGHNFDQARPGYVQLSAGPLGHAGDTAAMVAARVAVLSTGHFAPITDAVCAAAVIEWPGTGLAVDAGGGTGHYLAAVLDVLAGGWGLVLDASKAAVKQAARAHPRLDAIVADAWKPWPLVDASAGLLLNVFAPRNPTEFRRVLRPDGALLVVTPTADHLVELVGPLGLLRVDPTKPDRLDAAFGSAFALASTRDIRYRLTLGRDEVATLVGMGPSAWHREPAELAAAVATALAPEVVVTVAVRLDVYRPV